MREAKLNYVQYTKKADISTIRRRMQIIQHQIMHGIRKINKPCLPQYLSRNGCSFLLQMMLCLPIPRCYRGFQAQEGRAFA